METTTEFNNRFKVPPGFHRVEFDALDLKEECLEDEEIILIKAPINFSFDTIKPKLKLNGRAKNLLKESTTHYETSFSSDLPEEFKSYNVLIPREEPGRLEAISKKISGYLTITEDVDIPEWEAPPIVEKFVPFPEGLKPRFTPFGAQVTTPKSKRKKNKSRIENGEDETDCGVSPEKSRFEVTKVENDVSPQKMSKKEKKKKRKRDSNDETEDTQSSPEKKHKLKISELSSESGSPDKHKKKKRKMNDESLQEKTLLANLMKNEPPSVSPKKELKKKKETEWPSYIDSSPSNNWNSNVKDESIFSEDLNESEGKKRKKKKLKTTVESNIKSNAKVETEPSAATEIETKKEKKKKKPKEKSLTENEKSRSKKKKKKSS